MPPISRLLFAVLAAIALCHAGRIEKITEADRCSRLPDQYVRACLERICLGGQYVFEVERLMPNAAIIHPLPDSGIKDSARTGSSQCAVDSTSLASTTPYAASLLASKRESFQSARISALAFAASGVGVMILGDVYHMTSSLSAASKQDTIHLFEKEPESVHSARRERATTRNTIIEVGAVLTAIGVVRGLQALARYADFCTLERQLGSNVRLTPILPMTSDNGSTGMITSIRF